MLHKMCTRTFAFILPCLLIKPILYRMDLVQFLVNSSELLFYFRRCLFHFWSLQSQSNGHGGVDWSSTFIHSLDDSLHVHFKTDLFSKKLGPPLLLGRQIGHSQVLPDFSSTVVFPQFFSIGLDPISHTVSQNSFENSLLKWQRATRTPCELACLPTFAFCSSKEEYAPCFFPHAAASSLANFLVYHFQNYCWHTSW